MIQMKNWYCSFQFHRLLLCYFTFFCLENCLGNFLIQYFYRLGVYSYFVIMHLWRIFLIFTQKNYHKISQYVKMQSLSHKNHEFIDAFHSDIPKFILSQRICPADTEYPKLFLPIQYSDTLERAIVFLAYYTGIYNRVVAGNEY